MRLHVALLIASVAAPALAYAEPLSHAELQVLARHRHTDEVEIQLGRLAQRHGKSPGVQEFGATLVRDHSMHLASLDTFARQQGVTIPPIEPASAGERRRLAEEPQVLARLHAASGAGFDRRFLDQVIQDHDRELASLDGDIAIVKHPTLKKLLRVERPTVQRHLAQARMLDESNAQAARAPRPTTCCHGPSGS